MKVVETLFLTWVDLQCIIPPLCHAIPTRHPRTFLIGGPVRNSLDSRLKTCGNGRNLGLHAPPNFRRRARRNSFVIQNLDFIILGFLRYYAGRLSFDASVFTAMARGLLSSLHPAEKTVSQCDNASSGHTTPVSDAADLRGGSCQLRYFLRASRIDLAMAP